MMFMNKVSPQQFILPLVVWGCIIIVQKKFPIFYRILPLKVSGFSVLFEKLKKKNEKLRESSSTTKQSDDYNIIINLYRYSRFLKYWSKNLARNSLIINRHTQKTLKTYFD